MNQVITIEKLNDINKTQTEDNMLMLTKSMLMSGELSQDVYDEFHRNRKMQILITLMHAKPTKSNLVTISMYKDQLGIEKSAEETENGINSVPHFIPHNS